MYSHIFMSSKFYFTHRTLLDDIMLDDTDLLVLTINTYPALLLRPPTVVYSSVIRGFEGSGISGIAFSRVPLSHVPVVADPIQYCTL